MPNVFTGQEFAKHLSAGQLKKAIVKVGMAKKSEDTPDTILFAESRMCDEWISIPVSIIEQVTFLTNVTCRDHGHPLVAIQFKEPAAKDEPARVFADLARQRSHTQPMQSRRGRGRGDQQPSYCTDLCAYHFTECLYYGWGIYECAERFGRCLSRCGGADPNPPEAYPGF